MKSSSARRSGSALILAIVVLTVVMGILGTLLRLQVLRQKQLLHREWQLQAQCLAQSAHEFAVQQLQANLTYTGEIWTVEVPEASLRAGVAEISVQTGETAGTFAVTVVTHVPDHPQHRAQLTTTRTISLEAK